MALGERRKLPDCYILLRGNAMGTTRTVGTISHCRVRTDIDELAVRRSE